MKIFNWVLKNKLVILLLLVVLYLVFYKNNSFIPFGQKTTLELPLPAEDTMMKQEVSYSGSYVPEAPPTSRIQERMVVTENTLSLQVKNVAESLSQIKTLAEQAGGYMVESNLDRPEEAASGNIQVRVLQTKMNEALSSFKNIAVKVVSENLRGSDVTDEYVDNEAKLQILLRNKARFEEIMAKAATVEEILRVQEQIFNLQYQIDAIKGQQDFLAKNSEMAKITVYLATDELALPFTPDQPWRPEAIFKQAVRSLFLTLRSVIVLLIWLVVYSVIWLPITLLVTLLIKKYRTK